MTITVHTGFGADETGSLVETQQKMEFVYSDVDDCKTFWNTDEWVYVMDGMDCTGSSPLNEIRAYSGDSG